MQKISKFYTVICSSGLAIILGLPLSAHASACSEIPPSQLTEFRLEKRRVILVWSAQNDCSYHIVQVRTPEGEFIGNFRSSLKNRIKIWNKDIEWGQDFKFKVRGEDENSVTSSWSQYGFFQTKGRPIKRTTLHGELLNVDPQKTTADIKFSWKNVPNSETVKYYLITTRYDITGNNQSNYSGGRGFNIGYAPSFKIKVSPNMIEDYSSVTVTDVPVFDIYEFVKESEKSKAKEYSLVFLSIQYHVQPIYERRYQYGKRQNRRVKAKSTFAYVTIHDGTIVRTIP